MKRNNLMFVGLMIFLMTSCFLIGRESGKRSFIKRAFDTGALSGALVIEAVMLGRISCGDLSTAKCIIEKAPTILDELEKKDE